MRNRCCDAKPVRKLRWKRGAEIGPRRRARSRKRSWGANAKLLIASHGSVCDLTDESAGSESSLSFCHTRIKGIPEWSCCPYGARTRRRGQLGKMEIIVGTWPDELKPVHILSRRATRTFLIDRRRLKNDLPCHLNTAVSADDGGDRMDGGMGTGQV